MYLLSYINEKVSVADTAGNVFDAAAGIIGKGIEQYGQSAIDAVLWS